MSIFLITVNWDSSETYYLKIHTVILISLLTELTEEMDEVN